jgi:hypothetical protein
MKNPKQTAFTEVVGGKEKAELVLSFNSCCIFYLNYAK